MPSRRVAASPHAGCLGNLNAHCERTCILSVRLLIMHYPADSAVCQAYSAHMTAEKQTYVAECREPYHPCTLTWIPPPPLPSTTGSRPRFSTSSVMPPPPAYAEATNKIRRVFIFKQISAPVESYDYVGDVYVGCSNDKSPSGLVMDALDKAKYIYMQPQYVQCAQCHLYEVCTS